MIEGRHLESTTELFDSIRVLLEASMSVDVKSDERLPSILSRFLELKENYEDHLARESRLIFPVFKTKGLVGKKGSVTRKEMLHQLDHLRRDHKEIQGLLNRIRKASGGFQPVPSSSPSLKLCFAQFYQLEQELNTHFFLEEEALFPKLSEELKKLPAS